MMNIQEERWDYTAVLVAQGAITQDQCDTLKYKPEVNGFYSDYLSSLLIDNINWGWSAWQAAKTKAVPEGFVLVPKDSLKVALSWMDEDIDPWQMGGDSFAELYEHKPILEALIEAQEQKG